MLIHPFDVIKVRMQLIGNEGKQLSASRVGRALVSSEGIGGLYSGLSAAVLRQLTYTSLRVGLYDSLRKLGPGGDSGLKNAMAGIVAGGATALVTNPFDLALVRILRASKICSLHS